MPSIEINRRIAAAFEEIADLLEFAGEEGFRVAAYRKAARTVKGLSAPLPDLLRQHVHVPGIGKALAKKALEIEQTGTCRKLEELRANTPANARRLLAVKGLGPRHVRALIEAFGTDEAALRAAVARGEAARLPGFGPARIQALKEVLSI